MGVTIATADIISAAEKLKRFTVNQLADALGIKTDIGRRKVRQGLLRLQSRQIIRALIVKGTGARDAQGLLIYEDLVRPDGSRRLKHNIFRAMHIKRNFSRADIVKLSGACHRTVGRAIKALEASGEIAQTGIERGNRNRPVARFVVCDPDGFYVQNVK